MPNAKWLSLFLVLCTACTQKVFFEAVHYIPVKGALQDAMGDVCFMQEGEDLHFAVVDSIFGINVYDTTGQLLHYTNDPGILNLEFVSNSTLGQDSNVSVLSTFKPETDMVVLYVWTSEPAQLVPIVQFSQSELTGTYDVIPRSTDPGIQLLMLGADSTLNTWLIDRDSLDKTNITLQERTQMDYAWIEFCQDEIGLLHFYSDGKVYQRKAQGNFDPIEKVGSKFHLTDVQESQTIGIAQSKQAIIYRNGEKSRILLQNGPSILNLKDVRYHGSWLLLSGSFKDDDGHTWSGAILGKKILKM
jgi:hypothetical protein